jgi:hypothetical protein
VRPIKLRKDILSHPTYVIYDRTAGSPKCREAYGDGASIVVSGVTPTYGGWESQLQGEGRQVPMFDGFRRYANADRHPTPSNYTQVRFFFACAKGTGEPDELKGSRPVRRGVWGKVPRFGRVTRPICGGPIELDSF